MEHIIVTGVFSVVVLALLILDLSIIGKGKEISLKQAGFWSALFVTVAIGFSFFVEFELGKQAQTEFLTAYVIEKMLSVDNLFVFILIFSFFKVPKEYHHKVLFYGVLGAIIMRLIFIYLGVKVISLFEINIYGYDVNIILMLFGLFLAYMGIKTLINEEDDDKKDFNNSLGAKFIRKIFPRVTEEYHGDNFFVKKESQLFVTSKVLGRKVMLDKKTMVLYATPLLIVVGVVEFTDLLFAVDSIPAIFSVSQDPLILFTSNIFAILGLRSMYFLLAGLLPMFKHLGTGVSIILFGIGVKMCISPIVHVPSNISLYAILTILVLSVTISLITYKKK